MNRRVTKHVCFSSWPAGAYFDGADQVLTRGRSNSPSPARPTNRPPAPSGQLSGFVSPNGIGTAKWASGFQQALVSATQPRNPDQPTSSSSDPTFVAQDQEASLSTSPTSYSLSAPIVVKGQYRYSTDGVANRSTETPSPAPPAPQSLIITKTPTRSASETSAVGTAGSRSTAGPSGSPPRENSSEPAPWSSKRKGKKINSSSLPMAPPPSSIASVPMADGSAVMAEAISDRWPDALYHGWMRKRNKGKASTAKQRYLVVKINCIEYYADPSVRHQTFPLFNTHF